MKPFAELIDEEIEELQKKLDKIEKQLEGNRASVMDDGWQTSRFAKKSRKWDMLAQEKMKIRARIDDLTEERQRGVYACAACNALTEFDCVCDEMNEED